MIKCSIIISTKNEKENIHQVIHTIPKSLKSCSEIIVVDASTDGTDKIAKKLGAKVISSPPGKGLQMKIGARVAKGSILVFIDGDGEHPSEKIAEGVKLLNPCDLVIGDESSYNSFSRFVSGEIGFTDWFLSKTTDLEFQIYCNYPPILSKDSLNGFRVIRKKDFWRLSLEADFFEIETEMNLNALEKGFKIKRLALSNVKRLSGRSKSILDFVSGIKARKLALARRFN